MRFNAFLILLVIVGSSTVVFGQEPVCPSVSVEGPDGIHNNGAIMVFSAVISADAPKHLLKYEWSVTNGEIMEGQGKDRLTVGSNLTSGTNGSVVASVKIIGLPVKCEDTASYSSTVYRSVHHKPIARYEDVKWREERAILDTAWFTLINNPKGNAYFKIPYVSSPRRNAVIKHIAKIKKHIRFRDKTFDLNRLIFGVVKSDNKMITIWIFRSEDEPQFCSECEIVK